VTTDGDRTEWFEETYDATRHAVWRYGIARHVVAGTLRRTTDERRRTAAGGAGPAAAAGSAEEVTAGRLDALAALARLTAAEREAVRLVAWEGLSPGQAARVAGCSTATFTVRLHRARRRLARCLEEERNEAGQRNRDRGVGMGIGIGESRPEGVSDEDR
jgi:RNA polymerase sigma-70 factor (ECF subfamily)